MDAIKIINITLLGIAIVLILNLIQPIGTIVANIIYTLDTSQPQCYFYNSGEINEIQVDRCCYEIQKQLACQSIGKNRELKCYTSGSSERYYLINQKAFNYCKKEGYDVKLK